MANRPFKTSEIRDSFFDFFEKEGHERVPSSRVVPDSDATLLFTNAGMVQFKDVFLGIEQRPYRRAVSSQKCIRAGGKHNDLDNVGYTSRHHTFFEMMGNFSFGDYFKKEAIHYAWKYVTEELALPKDKLVVSVHVGDDEAAQIWQKQEGLSESQILRFDEDNFWSMGDTGPCGTSTEIFWDQGREIDGERYLEFWNCVFMQYDRDEAGRLTPLAKPSVDTGLGLERTAAILQGVSSNYEIDLLSNLVASAKSLVEERTKKTLHYNPDNLGLEGVALRVIVDHLRSTSFLIADGVLPSNEGRGYVLRRILRRAVRFGKRLGLESPFLTNLYPSLVSAMGSQYPELAERAVVVREVLKQEEERFYETLDKGLHILEGAFDRCQKSQMLPADVGFQLYDSFGFPLDLTALIAKERGFQIDESGFDQLMKAQQERSRASWKGSGAKVVPEAVKEWNALGVFPKFTAYQSSQETQAEVLATVPVEGENRYLWVAISPCPFYAESGGQVADTGWLRVGSHEFEVLDVQKPYDRGVSILVSGEVSVLNKGIIVEAKVNEVRRSRIRANHTSTHLLHAALREVLGDHVQQAGSLVNAEKLRFDFSHGKPLEPEQLKKVESMVKSQIEKNREVAVHEDLPFDDAIKSGAMALFGEKYSDKVRMIDVPGFSKELCGGLHVRNTGEICTFRILSEAGVAAGTRRIEAESGPAAIDSLLRESLQLKHLSLLLKTSESEIESKVHKLLQNQKDLEAQIKILETKALQGAGSAELSQTYSYKGAPLTVHLLKDFDPKLLREKGDFLRQKCPDTAHLLVCGQSLLATADTMRLKNFHSGDLIREITQALSGRGGGQPRTAQGVLGIDADQAGEEIKKWLEQQK